MGLMDPCFYLIGKTCDHNGIIRNFQFRKFLPVKSNIDPELPFEEKVKIYHMQMLG